MIHLRIPMSSSGRPEMALSLLQRRLWRLQLFVRKEAPRLWFEEISRTLREARICHGTIPRFLHVHEWIREYYRNSEFTMDFMPTKDMVADMFTKAFPSPRLDVTVKRMAFATGP